MFGYAPNTGSSFDVPMEPLMTKLLRLVLVSIMLTGSLPLAANCEHYQCSVGPDSASCWIRYGPLARKYPYATSCEPVCQCMQDLDTGNLYCNCLCERPLCYSA